jgi:predicted ribosome quality control (RQC) complex YloA/Tae2 family protein
VTQIDGERVLLFGFIAEDDLGATVDRTLAVQLTGASANLFLLDSERRIMDSARQTLGRGQQIGEIYEPPERRGSETNRAGRDVSIPDYVGLSARLDAEEQAKSVVDDFQSRVKAARSKLRNEISRREKLIRKLSDDLAGHGDAEKWKHLGDVLLANTMTARREGSNVFVTDYFADGAPEISIDVDENDSITDAAEKFFRRYTKARNARQEIEKRKTALAGELEQLRLRHEELETAVEAGDLDRVEEIGGAQKKPAARSTRSRRTETVTGARSFVSSDGFDILVGKKAKDNDFLTFRVAKSLDTWMHAADYPGSHVVIRNPNRKEIPHRTLLEAAQLAAFYSQGKPQPKAAVHYTQKKFVNKPKGSAPGLVSLASFKTLLVEPKIDGVKKKDED